jgi:hypothetical protein
MLSICFLVIYVDILWNSGNSDGHWSELLPVTMLRTTMGWPIRPESRSSGISTNAESENMLLAERFALQTSRQ